MSQLLLLLCPPRNVTGLVDEVAELLETAHVEARVMCYGLTNKAHDGFVVLLCPQFPRNLVPSLEGKITDYMLCSDDEQPGPQKPGKEGQA